MNTEQRAAMRKLAEEATPQDIDTALVIHDCDGKYIECPVCGGDGSVELEGDYCNFDSQAIGVQFYGIGKAHGAAEAYYRAANPSTILQLLDYIGALEKDAANKQARIDALTLEFCPEEMTKEQMVEWAKHQVPAKGETE